MTFHLLITDDDACLMALYRAAFGRMPRLAIDYASTPDDCRNFLARNHYDMVLLDISLTERGSDGIELLDEIVKGSPMTDVVMMSTMDDASTVDRCLSHGSAAFVSKNQNLIAALRHKVESMLFSRALGASALVAGASRSAS